MPISLASVQRVQTSEPPIITVYGETGLGKTSLAASFPDPIFVQIAPERAPADIEIATFGYIESYPDFMDALRAVAEEEHEYRTLVIDSLNALEKIVWAEACVRGQWKSIEDPGYGKGYIKADEVWSEVMQYVNWIRDNLGMSIVMLGLSDTETHEEPGVAPYKRYDLRLHKRARSLIFQTSDAVLFMNTKVVLEEKDVGFGRKSSHATGGNTRWLYTDAKPVHAAKNRFGMPQSIMLRPGQGYIELSKYLPGAVAGEPTSQNEEQTNG
jgi:hypothetical protein